MLVSGIVNHCRWPLGSPHIRHAFSFWNLVCCSHCGHKVATRESRRGSLCHHIPEVQMHCLPCAAGMLRGHRKLPRTQGYQVRSCSLACALVPPSCVTDIPFFRRTHLLPTGLSRNQVALDKNNLGSDLSFCILRDTVGKMLRHRCSMCDPGRTLIFVWW